jgi:hypothetical protein
VTITQTPSSLFSMTIFNIRNPLQAGNISIPITIFNK